MQWFVLNLDTFWEEATDRVAKLPIYERSHRQGAANEVGVLGEIAAEWWMRCAKVSWQPDKVTTHDYSLPARNLTVDVKTKDRTVPPQASYDCSVPLYNHSHQRPDWYLFVSLLRDKTTTGIERFTKAYVLGGCTQSDLDTGTIWRKGQTDTNGTTFWTDCINVAVKSLRTLDDVRHAWRGDDATLDGLGPVI